MVNQKQQKFFAHTARGSRGLSFFIYLLIFIKLLQFLQFLQFNFEAAYLKNARELVARDVRQTCAARAGRARSQARASRSIRQGRHGRASGAVNATKESAHARAKPSPGWIPDPRIPGPPPPGPRFPFPAESGNGDFPLSRFGRIGKRGFPFPPFFQQNREKRGKRRHEHEVQTVQWTRDNTGREYTQPRVSCQQPVLSQAQWLYEAPIQGPRESETARVNIF